MKRGQAAKNIRHEKAEQLSTERRHRTTEEQLELIKNRPGQSIRETKRLLAILEETDSKSKKSNKTIKKK